MFSAPHVAALLVFCRLGMDEPERPLHNGDMRAGLISICVYFAVYLLFAGSLSLSEGLTALVLAALSGAGTVLLAGVSDRHFRFSLHHAPVWGRALAGLPSATWKTGLALAGRLLGSAEAQGRADTRPFRRGQATEPRDRARRATAVLAMSLTPSTFVVDLPGGGNEALLHGIDRQPPVTNAEWLT